MIPIKTMLTGLAGVSLCMANIGGIVTDTGTTPISGAVVQLEKGGQTATTGADGRFTIMVSTAIFPGNSTLLPKGLSARISNNKLTMTIPDATTIEVTTFDLCGKALSTVRKTLDAGTHSIALPYRSAGIYLYRVKSGNKDILLKGNTIGAASFGSGETAQNPSSNSLAKQAKVAVAINDVIAATKTGYLIYRCVQYTSDTTGLQIKMIASAGTVTDTEGNVYQTVRIGNQVWMAENLRVTKYNDGSLIPLDTSTETWNMASTPKYCFFQNTTNADSIKKYGALYNWHVVNNGKLVPPGWHVPTDAQWDTLQNYLIAKGYNWDGTTTGNKIAKSLASKADWAAYTTTGTIGCDLTQNNRSGFSALSRGIRNCYGSFYDQSICGGGGYWWSATQGDASIAYDRGLTPGSDFLDRGDDDNKCCGFSVRLLRD